MRGRRVHDRVCGLFARIEAAFKKETSRSRYGLSESIRNRGARSARRHGRALSKVARIGQRIGVRCPGLELW